MVADVCGAGPGGWEAVAKGLCSSYCGGFPCFRVSYVSWVRTLRPWSAGQEVRRSGGQKGRSPRAPTQPTLSKGTEKPPLR